MANQEKLAIDPRPVLREAPGGTINNDLLTHGEDPFANR